MVGISKKSGTLKDIKYKEVFGGSTADAIKHIKYESMALGTLHFLCRSGRFSFLCLPECKKSAPRSLSRSLLRSTTWGEAVEDSSGFQLAAI